MKALEADGAGGLRFAGVEDPRPAPYEVVVAVEAFGVNRGETFLLEAAAAGRRPGKDVAGTVVEAAADGSGPAAGTRVVAHVPGGGWAEQVAVPTSALAGLPPVVDSITAAALPLAGLTALRLVRVVGPLDGRRVLLTGASGGVGHYFVELATPRGAQITAVSRGDRGAGLLARGASAVVDQVAAAGDGFDVALESVGGTSFTECWQALHESGLLVWFGQAGRQPTTIDFFNWGAANRLTIRKFSYLAERGSLAGDLATLVARTAAGDVTPELGFVADWADTQRGVDALLARQVRGNVVLTI